MWDQTKAQESVIKLKLSRGSTKADRENGGNLLLCRILVNGSSDRVLYDSFAAVGLTTASQCSCENILCN
jgi:hypothetical protein